MAKMTTECQMNTMHRTPPLGGMSGEKPLPDHAAATRAERDPSCRRMTVTLPVRNDRLSDL